MKIKAFDLRTKSKGDLLKKLDELKNELAQVRRLVLLRPRSVVLAPAASRGQGHRRRGLKARQD